MALSEHQLSRKYPYPILATGNLVDTFRTGKGPSLERPDDKDLAIGWDARDSLRGHFVQIFQAIERIQKNVRLTPGAQAIDIGNEVRKRMEAGLVKADIAHQRLTDMQQRIATRVEIALRPPDPYMAALLPELRTYLRSLGETKRDDLIAKETHGDDALTYLHAIASAPPALSSMVRGLHTQFKNILLGIKDPSLLGMEAAFERELQLLERAAKGFEEQIRDHVDFETADELRKLSDA